MRLPVILSLSLLLLSGCGYGSHDPIEDALRVEGYKERIAEKVEEFNSHANKDGWVIEDLKTCIGNEKIVMYKREKKAKISESGLSVEYELGKETKIPGAERKACMAQRGAGNFSFTLSNECSIIFGLIGSSSDPGSSTTTMEISYDLCKKYE